HPVNARVIHTGPRPRLIGNECPGVVASCRNKRPAIVMTGDQYVHLVAAHGADLRLPEFSRFRMEREPVSIAMAVGKNFGLRPGTSDKRVVGGNCAIIPKPKRLSDMIAWILRLDAKAVVVGSSAANSIAIADSKVERCIGTKEKPARKVSASFPGIGNKDLLNLFNPGALEAAAGDGNCCPSLAALRIRHIEEIVLCEPGMQRKSVQPVTCRTRRTWRCPESFRQKDASPNHP